MYRISITPQWQLDRGSGPESLPRLIELLTQIHETGTLRAACARLQLSYRYAWGLLKCAEETFGVPLVLSRRGRGAVLSALGDRLVWADRRIAARLGPVLDSLAAEVEAEIERSLTQAQGILRLHASHGFAVETLRHRYAERRLPLDLKYVSSQEALAGLARDTCDLAGFHVPIGTHQRAMLAYYARWLQPQGHRLVLLATRRQGLMLAPGNPRRIRGFADLTRAGVRFINRQPDAGTRQLLDLLLRAAKVDVRKISGYDSSEFTHAAVAAYVASGMADAGFGVETPAQRFGLDFLPLVTERYFFACPAALLETAPAQALLKELRSTEFRASINALAGYDAMAAGTVLTMAEAFGVLPHSHGRFKEGSK